MGHRRFLESTHMWRMKNGLFNGSAEDHGPPIQLNREDMITQIQNIDLDFEFGKAKKK